MASTITDAISDKTVVVRTEEVAVAVKDRRVRRMCELRTSEAGEYAVVLVPKGTTVPVGAKVIGKTRWVAPPKGEEVLVRVRTDVIQFAVDAVKEVLDGDLNVER